MSHDDKKWVKISSHELLKTGFFRLRVDEARLPSGKICLNYYVMDFSDWVNIVALTKDRQMILIKQFRYAIEELCIETPGGAIDPRHSETPEEAAKRELIEETGFVPGKMKLLSEALPNPAIQSNKLWIYLALDCEKKEEQKLDAFEDIEVFTLPIQDALKMVQEGKITHALVIASIHLALPYLNDI
jgi:ADP-ribose pyrophosphatase